MGWDAKSLILMLRDGGGWHAYRLPKASHSYDGAHGWNTEWPRIREIGEGDDLLMTMHGMFWKFPKGFSVADTSGIAPRSSYLKVIGDFCQWQDRLVFGCDDTAKSEFLNKRKAKGEIAAPQSQSNLWFVDPAKLDHLGPVIGRGSVWLREGVAAGTKSDPYLFAGLKHRALHLAHGGEGEVSVALEIDRDGKGSWEPLRTVVIPPKGYLWTAFDESDPGVWIRLAPSADATELTAAFTNADDDERAAASAPAKFAGIATAGSVVTSGGVIRARGENKRNLHFAARTAEGSLGLYTLSDTLTLTPEENATELAWLENHAAIPSREGVIDTDAASVIYTDDAGKRFRLPGAIPPSTSPMRSAVSASAARSRRSGISSTATAPSSNCPLRTRRASAASVPSRRTICASPITAATGGCSSSPESISRRRAITVTSSAAATARPGFGSVRLMIFGNSANRSVQVARGRAPT
jgi:hypothetical protein